jgi:hypothetical protein
MPFDLFPRPRNITVDGPVLDFSGAQWVTVGADLPARLKAAVGRLAGNIGHAFARPLLVTAATPAEGDTFLAVRLAQAGANPEGYRLRARPSGIELTASGESGVFYGLQTLEQIVAQEGARFPAFDIADEPGFLCRGIMLDISRCKVPTMETLFRIVDLMARLKLNQLQLYTEHTFAFSAHEAVWRDASPMTPDEVRVLDRYCADRHIELVPNLNSFGHFERWLRHPQYHHLAECPDGFEYRWGGRSPWGSVLRPNEESLRFLDSLYAELLPNFTSALFNVGCDETWELGQGWSKEICAQRGTTRVYLDFLLGINELVRQYGRKMMFWGEIILHDPALIAELPDEMIALEWGYEADHGFDERCRPFSEAGGDFYVCPGTSSWNSLTGRTANCLENLANAALNGRRHGAAGYLITDWGDGGHHQYLPISYPGFFAGAALSWCADSYDESELPAAIDRMLLWGGDARLAGLLLDLGRVLELVPKRMRNSSIFNRLLFSPIGSGSLLDGVPPDSLAASLARLDELEKGIAATRAEAGDGRLVKAELCNAIAMARCGALKGLVALRPDAGGADQLRRGLQRVIDEHGQLWLARNRPGGLRESSEHLKKQLEELD